MTLEALLPGQSPDPGPPLHSATIRLRGGDAYAVIPTFSADQDWGPLAGETSGLAEGDAVTVAFADDGTPWLLGRVGITVSGELVAALKALIPPGSVIEWPGAAAPSGWLLCDGSSYLRADYPELFANLGGAASPWGLPDGTHFKVPDYRDRVPLGKSATKALASTGGAETVTLGTTEIPSHSHGDGTLAVESHSHSDGTLSVASHSHDDGTLSAASHTHGKGTLQITSSGAHSHTDAGHSHQFSGNAQAVINGSGGSAFSSGSNWTLSYIGTGHASLSTDSHAHPNDYFSGDTGSASPDVTGSTGSASPDVTGSTGSASPDVSGSTAAAGGGGAHNNMQPYVTTNFIIKA